jgi:hypothetical protein
VRTSEASRSLVSCALRRNLFAMLPTLFLVACGGGGEDPNNGWICIGGCPSEGITAVSDDIRADHLASAIADVAMDAVPSGTYTGRVVNGLSGSASFSGHSTSSSGSCGSSCVSRSHSTNVTAVFDNYRAKLGSNQEVTLTGTATLTDTTSNRTTATSSSSSGSLSVESANLVARHAITETSGQVWGEADTVDFSVRSSTGSNWSGTLKGGNGVTYSF